jgi:hypothetical protein
MKQTYPSYILIFLHISLLIELAQNADKHQITFALRVIGLTQKKKKKSY